jgi:hypothetical protein
VWILKTSELSKFHQVVTLITLADRQPFWCRGFNTEFWICLLWWSQKCNFFCISSSLRDIKYKQLEQEHSFILLFYIKKLSHNDFREWNWFVESRFSLIFTVGMFATNIPKPIRTIKQRLDLQAIVKEVKNLADNCCFFIIIIGTLSIKSCVTTFSRVHCE